MFVIDNFLSLILVCVTGQEYVFIFFDCYQRFEIKFIFKLVKTPNDYSSTYSNELRNTIFNKNSSKYV